MKVLSNAKSSSLNILNVINIAIIKTNIQLDYRLERNIENIHLALKNTDYNFYTIKNFETYTIYFISAQNIFSENATHFSYGLYDLTNHTFL